MNDIAIQQLINDQSIFEPTYLYIKQHNKTGLKYFGKTIKNPISYIGSGTYWLNHLKVHGNDVATIWHQLFENKNDLISYALEFSIKNNILNSKDNNGRKIWANLMIETGIGPGSHSKETKRKIGVGNKNKIVSKDTGNKISISRRERFNEIKKNNYSKSKSGIKNPAWKGYVISPDGIFDCCESAGLYYGCSAEVVSLYCKSIKYSNWHRTFKIDLNSDIITSISAKELGKLNPTKCIISKPSRSGWQGFIITPLGIFKNAGIASTYFSCDPSTIMRRCRNKKYTDWKLTKELNSNDTIIDVKKVIKL